MDSRVISWDDNKPRRRINGALTGQFNGQQVTIMGQCIATDSKQMKLKCTDDHVILVQLVDPIDSIHPIATNAYVEVQGILESRNKLKAYKVYVFDSEMTANFDAKLYNEMIGQMMTYADANTYYVTANSAQ